MAEAYRGVRIETRGISSREGGTGSTVSEWSRYQHHPVSLQHVGAINQVGFCPVEPHLLAVSNSTQVQILDQECQPVFSLRKFKDVVYSAAWRKDGRLLATGGEHPSVKIFSTEGKQMLRSFRFHHSAVHVTRFSASTSTVFTGSDDHTSRCIDIAAESEIACLKGHKDYIRAGAASPSNEQLWATGGYDHQVLLWDMRHQQAVITIDHGAPVESLVFFPAGSILASAGENTVKLWDVLSGGKLLHCFSNHQKTVTCLALDGLGSRLFAGGADHHVRVYDIATYETAYTFNFSAPVLTVDVSPDNTRIAAGMNDGVLTVRSKKAKPGATSTDAEAWRETKEQRDTGSHRYFLHNVHTKVDFVVQKEREKKLQQYDRYLKTFEYSSALDAAVESSDPIVITCILEELMRRNALTQVLAGRTESSLKPFLTYLIKYITNPSFTTLLLEISNAVLDIYGPSFGQSSEIDSLFASLKEKLADEISTETEMLELIGAIDMILNASIVS